MRLFGRRKSNKYEDQAAEIIAAARRPSEELAGVALAERDATLAILLWVDRQLDDLVRPGGKQVTFAQLRDLRDAARVKIGDAGLDLSQPAPRRDTQSPTGVVPPVVE